jgi:hypothetical protein
MKEIEGKMRDLLIAMEADILALKRVSQALRIQALYQYEEMATPEDNPCLGFSTILNLVGDDLSNIEENLSVLADGMDTEDKGK